MRRTRRAISPDWSGSSCVMPQCVQTGSLVRTFGRLLQDHARSTGWPVPSSVRHRLHVYSRNREACSFENSLNSCHHFSLSLYIILANRFSHLPHNFIVIGVEALPFARMSMIPYVNDSSFPNMASSSRWIYSRRQHGAMSKPPRNTILMPAIIRTYASPYIVMELSKDLCFPAVKPKRESTCRSSSRSTDLRVPLVNEAHEQELVAVLPTVLQSSHDEQPVDC